MLKKYEKPWNVFFCITSFFPFFRISIQPNGFPSLPISSSNKSMSGFYCYITKLQAHRLTKRGCNQCRKHDQFMPLIEHKQDRAGKISIFLPYCAHHNCHCTYLRMSRPNCPSAYSRSHTGSCIKLPCTMMVLVVYKNSLHILQACCLRAKIEAPVSVNDYRLNPFLLRRSERCHRYW